MLYKLFKSQLMLQSEHFRNMFSIPPENSHEGMDDEHPIVIEGIIAEDFDHVCAFMSGQ